MKEQSYSTSSLKTKRTLDAPKRMESISKSVYKHDDRRRSSSDVRNRRKRLRIPLATVAFLAPEGPHKEREVFVRDIKVVG